MAVTNPCYTLVVNTQWDSVMSDVVKELHFIGKDGKDYLSRPIRPDDAASLMRGYDAMTDQSKWFRLLHAVPHLTDQMAYSYTHPDPKDEVCLVIEGKDDLAGEILGGARVANVLPGQMAEFSVSLRPEALGLGLAHHALQAVIDIARARGCAGVWGEIAKRNDAMLELAQHLGMTVRRDPEDWSMRVAELLFDETRPA